MRESDHSSELGIGIRVQRERDQPRLSSPLERCSRLSISHCLSSVREATEHAKVRESDSDPSIVVGKECMQVLEGL